MGEAHMGEAHMGWAHMGPGPGPLPSQRTPHRKSDLEKTTKSCIFLFFIQTTKKTHHNSDQFDGGFAPSSLI